MAVLSGFKGAQLHLNKWTVKRAYSVFYHTKQGGTIATFDFIASSLYSITCFFLLFSLLTCKINDLFLPAFENLFTNSKKTIVLRWFFTTIAF